MGVRDAGVRHPRRRGGRPGVQARDQAVHAEIAALRQKLVEAPLPQVVEREARQRLHWGFPDEERIVIVRR